MMLSPGTVSSCVRKQAVQQKSEKIGEEQAKCQHMADLAQADLAEALPALEEAMKVNGIISFLSVFLTYCDRMLAR